MQWLSPSSEGRQFVKVAVLTVMLAFLVVGAAEWTLERQAALLRDASRLEARAAVLAGVMDKTPELDRTHVLLQEVAQRSQGGEMPTEAFVVTTSGVVHVSARDEETDKPWDTVAARVAAEWPGFLLARAPLHRDPAAPARLTGALYVAAPAPRSPPLRDALLAGLTGSLVLALLLAPLLTVLERGWFNPLHRIVLANRGGQDESRVSYQMLPSAVAPPGQIREIIFHRNQMLETLKSRDDVLSRRTRDAETLAEFQRSLLGACERAEVPALSLRALAEAVEFDVAVLLLHREEQTVLAMHSQGPLSEVVQAESERLAIAAYYDRSFVQLAGEKVHVTHFVTDRKAARIEGGFRASCWMPILVEEKHLGIIGCLSMQRRQFDSESLRFLTLQAQSLSLAFKTLPQK